MISKLICETSNKFEIWNYIYTDAAIIPSRLICTISIRPFPVLFLNLLNYFYGVTPT